MGYADMKQYMEMIYHIGVDTAARAKENIFGGIELLIKGPELAYAKATANGKDYLYLRPPSRPNIPELKNGMQKRTKTPKSPPSVKGPSGRWFRKK